LAPKNGDTIDATFDEMFLAFTFSLIDLGVHKVAPLCILETGPIV